MSEEKEYIVTLHNHSDCEQFYDEMESNKSTEFIPGKEFNCIHRKESSRNTHYSMTDEEVARLCQDSRILGIEEPPENRGLEIIYCMEWDSTTHFDRYSIIYPRPPAFGDPEPIVTNSKVQWGILRCASGNQQYIDAEYTTDIPMPFDKVDTGDQDGENVDVIISDRALDPLHPEFAVNRDGTGGSRVVSNWSNSPDEDVSHGCHVAGTVAGNRQGWAPKANIYRIASGGNFDAIRTWHNNKTNGNPTVVNCSWVWAQSWWFPIDEVYYRGTTYTNVGREDARNMEVPTSYSSGPNKYGTGPSWGYWQMQMPVIAVEADMQDAMDDGVIIVCAADNFNNRMTNDPQDPDYNNYINDTRMEWNTGFWPHPGHHPYYYARGGTPNATPGVICVGAAMNFPRRQMELEWATEPYRYGIMLETSTDVYNNYGHRLLLQDEGPNTDIKEQFSSKGPRVDIFAPGTYIQSSTHKNENYGITDNRSHNSSFDLSQNVYSGTSMASPQVAGVVACLVGIYRDFKQEDVRSWLISQGSKNDQLYDNETHYGIDYNAHPELSTYAQEGLGYWGDDKYALGGAPNRYLYFNRVRKGTGQVWPNPNHRTKVVQSPNNYPVQSALPTRQVYPRMKRNYNVP